MHTAVITWQQIDNPTQPHFYTVVTTVRLVLPHLWKPTDSRGAPVLVMRVTLCTMSHMWHMHM